VKAIKLLSTLYAFCTKYYTDITGTTQFFKYHDLKDSTQNNK